MKIWTSSGRWIVNVCENGFGFREKKMYICEGFMDCIALWKASITNSVALMGTAFTKEHLKVFKYLGVEIILTMDADDPGNINANKLANELLENKFINDVNHSYTTLFNGFSTNCSKFCYSVFKIW